MAQRKNTKKPQDNYNLTNFTQWHEELNPKVCQEVVKKLIQVALEGDTTILKFLGERISPMPRKGSFVKIKGLSGLDNLLDVKAAYKCCFDAAANGDISLSELRELTQSLEGFSQSLEKEEIVNQINMIVQTLSECGIQMDPKGASAPSSSSS